MGRGIQQALCSSAPQSSHTGRGANCHELLCRSTRPTHTCQAARIWFAPVMNTQCLEEIILGHISLTFSCIGASLRVRSWWYVINYSSSIPSILVFRLQFYFHDVYRNLPMACVLYLPFAFIYSFLPLEEITNICILHR